MESTLKCPYQEKEAVRRVRNVMTINSVTWDPNRPGIICGDILVGYMVGLVVELRFGGLVICVKAMKNAN